MGTTFSNLVASKNVEIITPIMLIEHQHWTQLRVWELWRHVVQTEAQIGEGCSGQLITNIMYISHYGKTPICRVLFLLVYAGHPLF